MKNIKIGQRYFDPEDYTIYFVLLLNEENNYCCVASNILKKETPEYSILTPNLIHNELVLLLEDETITEGINRVISTNKPKFKLYYKLNREEDYSVLETYYYLPTTENIFDSLESSYISEEQVQDIRSGLEVKTQNETFKLVKISDD